MVGALLKRYREMARKHTILKIEKKYYSLFSSLVVESFLGYIETDSKVARFLFDQSHFREGEIHSEHIDVDSKHNHVCTVNMNCLHRLGPRYLSNTNRSSSYN